MRWLVVWAAAGCVQGAGPTWDVGSWSGEGGLSAPPELRPLHLCQPSHVVPGERAVWEVSGAEPGETVHIGMSFSLQLDGKCPRRLEGVCVDLRGPWHLGEQTADVEGIARFPVDVPAHASVGITTHSQAAAVGAKSAVTTAVVLPSLDDPGLCGGPDVCDGALCCEHDADGDGLCDGEDACPSHVGELLDCEGMCIDADWLGDGLCDATLDCEALAHDEGDCTVPCDDGDGDGLCDGLDLCPLHPGELLDCAGDCAPDLWLGDGVCDPELDCERFGWDEADCAGVGVPTEPGAAIDPASPTSVDDLVCRLTREAVDADTAELSYFVRWTRDGVAFEHSETTVWPGDTVPHDHTSPGSDFGCELVASDGLHESLPGTDVVTIGVPWALSVDVQDAHGCMVDDARRGHCWGHDSSGRVTGVEADLEYDLIGIAETFSCGLLHGGGMHCWGNLPDVLPEPEGFVALDGYERAMCALDAGGAVHCFGSGDQVGAEPAVTFVQIDVGTDYGCGVLEDEQLACWGRDVAGRTLPPAGTFVQVSAGHNHACAINTAGLVRCWGSADYGKTDTAELSGTFESVVAGLQHSCAIAAGGAATCWGRDSDGRLDVPEGATWVQLSAAQHTCGVTDSGEVRCWGSNTTGEAPEVAYDPALEL